MCIRVHLWLILFFAAAPCAYGQETPADLVAKLGSRTYAEREMAAKKLEQLGAVALPALRASYSNADLETRRRAVTLMDRIEDRLLIDEIVKPTPTRLRVANTRFEAARQAIQLQTGLALGGRDLDPPLTIDTGELPFWQAWREYCKAAKIHEADPTRWSAKLKAIDASQVKNVMERLRKDGDGIAYSPAFPPPRIEFADQADGAYVEDNRHSVRVRMKWQSLEADAAVFAVEVRTEPRLKLVAMPRAEITKLIDADGRERKIAALRPYPDTYPGDAAEILALHTGEMQFGGLVQLRSFAWQGPMTPLKEVHGRVRLEVNVHPPLMEIANVLASAGKETRSYDGITMKIVKASQNGGQARLQIRFAGVESLLPPGDPPKAVRVRPGLTAILGPMDVALQRLELRAANAYRCPLVESSYDKDGDGHLASLLFDVPTFAGDYLTLVMTKEPRRVSATAPFLVRDVLMHGVKN